MAEQKELRFKGKIEEEVEGHSGGIIVLTDPDDVEGHNRFQFEVDDGDVRGHLNHLQGAEVTGTDGDGNTVKLVIDKVEGDDVEGHLSHRY